MSLTMQNEIDFTVKSIISFGLKSLNKIKMLKYKVYFKIIPIWLNYNRFLS